MPKKRNIIHATINAVDGAKELILQKAARRELILAVIAIGFFLLSPECLYGINCCFGPRVVGG